jgi:hypothetical protein
MWAKNPSASRFWELSTMHSMRSIAELVIQDSSGLADVNALVKAGNACSMTVS